MNSEPSLLSIDPGNTSGITVIAIGRTPRLLHHEVWKSEFVSRPTSVVTRLREQHNIVRAAIEDQFLKINVQSLKRLARTSGNWEEACLANRLEVIWVPAKTWQTRVLGHSANKREQIDKVMKLVAYQDTRTLLTADESASWCMGRYIAVELYQGKINAILQKTQSQRGANCKSKQLVDRI